MATVADARGISRNVNPKNTELEIARFAGCKVAAVWTTKPLCRDGFHTAVSVSGPLEAKEAIEGLAFRVLVDDGNYAYFTAEDVVGLVIKNTRFGEDAVIYLTA